MKFGEIEVKKACGAYLAHTTRHDGLVLKKGHLLTEQDCAALLKAGLSSVVVALLDSDDVHEDTAAHRISGFIAGEGTHLSPAHTGRCNIIADVPGVVRIDEVSINRLNAIDETVTVATLPNLSAADAGQIVATVKIIPFAVSGVAIAKVSDAASALSSVVTVTPYNALSVSMINTVVPALKESVVEKTTALTKQRVASVGSNVKNVVRCDHSQAAIASAISDTLKTKPDLIVVVGASVTVDRADVVPAGIIQSGGQIVHFGMPVDPGNLMLLAKCNSVPVLVLPGCARSPKLNGIDWVLQRLAAGLTLGSAEIMAMGVGGLLVDSPVRPLPREEAVRDSHANQENPKIGAVILAAGQSRRMGGTNKLLETIDGVALIRRTVEEAITALSHPVVVVTGHQAEAVSEVLAGLNHVEIYNQDYAGGLSTSLRAGLDALSPDIDGAVVCLGDMPAVSKSHIDALAAGFAPDRGKVIGVPVHQGKRGNPVLWGRRFFGSMTEIHGDVGARHLIGDHEDLVYEVEFGDTAVLTDLDTPEAWERYRSDQAT